VNRDGVELEGATSIYADGFAIYGLTEYARATGDQEAIDLALATYENVQDRLARPGSYETAPYPLPMGIKAHGVSMIFSSVFHELGLLLSDDTILAAGRGLADEVLDVFLQPDQGLLYEYVHLDGSLVDSPQGRSIVPGHVIECMWFLIEIYQHWEDDVRIKQAVDTIRRHIEYGWDAEFGGILLARDASGAEPWWPFADTKLWWPHTEALYALLLAYEVSNEEWTMAWYEKVHDYAFSHYPVPIYGEWTQKLDRQGEPFAGTVALPVKDPFHLPRTLINCVSLLQRLTDED
jgi:N-acylglucosamine 2-epimerase